MDGTLLHRTSAPVLVAAAIGRDDSLVDLKERFATGAGRSGTGALAGADYSSHSVLNVGLAWTQTRFARPGPAGVTVTPLLANSKWLCGVDGAWPWAEGHATLLNPEWISHNPTGSGADE